MQTLLGVRGAVASAIADRVGADASAARVPSAPARRRSMRRAASPRPVIAAPVARPAAASRRRRRCAQTVLGVTDGRHGRRPRRDRRAGPLAAAAGAGRATRAGRRRTGRVVAPRRSVAAPVVARAGRRRAGRRRPGARRAGRSPQPRPARQEEGGRAATKGKFRETMWFKKGDLDAQAAQAAAEERARTGKDVATDKADSLPIDERYKDDGSITRGDKEKYSLRTGATQMMAAVDAIARRQPSGTKVSEDALIGEMKKGRSMDHDRRSLIAVAVDHRDRRRSRR